ncbi:MAG: acyl-CoA/acyl-ACP dehydrogenase [Microthrixaceae bacterium]|nr:acyl-CoA/acyl-ACP dehydrogenase [Microthrixaceae bacterium]
MNFDLSDDQSELRKVARSFLASRCPTTEVRRLETDPLGYAPELWAEMAAMGWVGMALPEGGGDLIDLAVVFEELGRAVCPTPMFSTIALGALLLADVDRLPPGVHEGTTVIGTALVDVPDDALVAEVSGTTARVSGTVPFAYDVEGADLLVLDAGGVVVLADAQSPSIQASRLASISNDRLFELRLDAVEGEVIGDSADVVGPSLARATALRCVELVGVMDRALEMAAEYARTRVQFGKPLGSFQAVQHRLADMLLDLEAARLVAYRSVWALTGDPGAQREVSIAKAWISDACQRLAFGAQQVHGGVGVDLDYDLQLYFRRAKALELELGSAPQHRERVAATIGLR